MKPQLRPLLLVLAAHIAAFSGAVVAAEPSGTNAARLLIAPCTTSVPLGKVNLRVGGLTRKGGVYSGEYQVKVSPLFFAGEKGRLTVTCPDELLQKLIKGAPVDFVGKAVTSGSGKTRPVRARAVPGGNDHGTVALRFVADNTELAFTTTYRFVGE